MKVVFLVYKFPTISETFIINQIEGLMDAGIEVKIFSTYKPEAFHRIHEEFYKYKFKENTHYYEIPTNRIFRLIRLLRILVRHGFRHFTLIKKCLNVGEVGLCEALNQLFKAEPFFEEEFDIAHTHYGTNGLEYTFLKNLFPHIKLVTTFHGYDLRKAINGNEDMYQPLFDRSDSILSISNSFTTVKLIEFGCPKDQITLHPNGIKLDCLWASQKKSELERIHVITVARLVPEKNLTFSLDIIKELNTLYPNRIIYHIVGGGELKNELMEYSKTLNLEDVVLIHGVCSQQRVIELYQQSHIFMLTSIHEVLPTVLMEAQAMKLPVVTSDVGGIRDVVEDGKTGFVVKGFSIDDFVSHVSQLIDNPDKMTKMGVNGRRFVAVRFDIKELTPKLIKHYQRLVEK